jgi:hypothetical protein
MRMSRFDRIVALSGQETGAVLVMLAVFAPVAILLAGFAIDTGNWWLHKRHLQVQADAAALAAAQGFQPCVDTSIYKLAGQYGGVKSVRIPGGATVSSETPEYNVPTGGPVHELINSQTYYEQPAPVDSSASTASPCTGEMVDVKLTETGQPWWLRTLSHVASFNVNAHARVEILQQTTDKGTFPVAVNNFAPRSVEAYFVDESASPAKQLGTCGPNGTSLCSVSLTADGTVEGESVWDNKLAAYRFPIEKPNVGVRIAVTGRSGLTGNMATDCKAGSGVECFDASSSTLGLLHIQGYSANGAASVTAPIVRQVQLAGAPGGCSDGYFSNSSATCNLAVTATVDWGTLTKPTGADVDAMVNGTCYALTFQSFSGTDETWRSTATVPATSCEGFKASEHIGTGATGYVPLPSGSRGVQVNLRAKDSSKTVEALAVQRSYAANSAPTGSGPIQSAVLGQVGGAARDADSFRLCEPGNTGPSCAPELVVTVHLTGSLQDAQTTSDPVYTMRFSGTGSQNQSVNCAAVNQGQNYAASLASGCAGTWAINPTLTCPGTTTPQDCISPATGNKENQVAKGMNERILGAEKPSICTSPNHWHEFIFTNGIPNVSATDPRVVTVFLTPYGSFGGSGASSEFPIALFATFYVTGWQDNGNGFSNPCQSAGDDTAQPGTIVGHFIKYVDTASNQGGETKCTPNSVGECIAVLTR